MLEDKYTGLLLAISSTIAIGTSYVITKLGLLQAKQRNGFEGDGHEYLKNPIWWGGLITLGLGEFANFAAYAFAPAILVTPLGALSVLSGGILGSYVLKERLGTLGKLGCAICLMGSVIIVVHAPPDKEIETVDQIMDLAIKPAFLIYCSIVMLFTIVMIYKVAPKYGKTNPLYYLSVCSTAGSISVMSIKAFGIALKLTFAGKNQFTHPSTYAFAIVVVVCIITQMNYLNKALSHFPQSIVNPLYYVTFTTAVLSASFILFQGFNTTDRVNTVSLLSGFLIIFTGVYLLNLSQNDCQDEDEELAGEGAHQLHSPSKEGDIESGRRGSLRLKIVPRTSRTFTPRSPTSFRRSVSLRSPLALKSPGHYEREDAREVEAQALIGDYGFDNEIGEKSRGSVGFELESESDSEEAENHLEQGSTRVHR